MNQIVLFTNDPQPCGEGPGAKERMWVWARVGGGRGKI